MRTITVIVAYTLIMKRVFLQDFIYNQVMTDFLFDLKNKFDFFLREYLRFSRKNYSEPYSRQFELQNLYITDVLNKYFEVEYKTDARILDVGSKNWFYVKGEYDFLKSRFDKFSLDGIEIDSNRLYSNFYSRGEVAKFYIKNLENVSYLAKDFLLHEEKYDFIIWILPFVFEYPHLKWRLPLKCFCPEKMLLHAYQSLNEGGKMFIINQGEAEYQEQIRLCEKLGLNFKFIGKVESEFFDYTQRFGVLVLK